MTATSNNSDDQGTPVALALSVLTSLFALTALGTSKGGEGMTGTEFVLLLAFFPMLLLAFVLVIYGAVQAFKRERERGYFFAVTLFALPLPALVIIKVVKDDWVSNKAANRAASLSKWSPNVSKIADLFEDFYRVHPDQIKRLKEEEVEPIGFMAFCQARPEFKQLEIPHDASHFLDFDGKPVRYYVDFNRNGIAADCPVIAGGVVVTDSGTSNGSGSEDGTEQRRFVYFATSPNGADAVASLLFEYYKEHPERIKILNGEEIVPDARFVPFCRERHLSMRIAPDPSPEHRPEVLVDISNQPVRYFIDFDQNGMAGPCPSVAGGVAVLMDEKSSSGLDINQESGLGTAPRNAFAKKKWADSLRDEYLRSVNEASQPAGKP